MLGVPSRATLISTFRRHALAGTALQDSAPATYGIVFVTTDKRYLPFVASHLLAS
jgi:hypothetical protein